MFLPSDNDKGFRQSEILSNVIERQIDLKALKTEDKPVIDIRLHPYAVILTQDCDLDWDFSNRFPAEGSTSNNSQSKLVPSILLCEVVEAKNIQVQEQINSKIWDRIKKNKDERYHFISRIPNEDDLEGKGLPVS